MLGVIQRPELIEQKIRENEQEGYGPTIEGLEHRVADLTRQQAQLSRAIGMLDASETDALVAQYRLVGEQKSDTEQQVAELAELQTQFERWRDAMRQVSEWCAAMDEMEWTYQRKRQALHVFNVRVEVRPMGSETRWRATVGVGSHCVSNVKPDGHAEEVLNYIETH